LPHNEVARADGRKPDWRVRVMGRRRRKKKETEVYMVDTLLPCSFVIRR